MQKESIAILGWGSLIWDVQPEFDCYHGWWCFDGPELPLEFSRISKTRQGALTLVIDKKHGTHCKVAYSFSHRRNVDEATCDLRCREGTSLSQIGRYFPTREERCTPGTPKSIVGWCHKMGFSAVIWTALQSNFKKCHGKDFCIEEAFAHLNDLPPVGKEKAREYFANAPDFITTDLLSEIRRVKWNGI